MNHVRVVMPTAMALAMQVVASLTSLQIVTASFPLVEAMGKVPAVSDEEADLLRQLAAKQLKAERSARAAMAASRRAVPESSEAERYAGTMDFYLIMRVAAYFAHHLLGQGPLCKEGLPVDQRHAEGSMTQTIPLLLVCKG